MITTLWRVAVIALAIAGAIAPIPPETVERFYSGTSYPIFQRALTGFSNFVPFALFDALLLGVAFWWIAMAVVDLARRRARGWRRVTGRLLVRTLVVAAAIYLAFLASWGLNYRRVPLTTKLGFDPALVSTESVRFLAGRAVEELNALYEPASGGQPADQAGVDPSLAHAFALAQESLGVRYPARPARPKQTLLDGYFRAAAVEGMTAPFVLETLVPSDLLPVERPAVIAHEWSHLAGFADEGEAGFVAWLACLRGSPRQRYSGWLFLYGEAAGALPAADRDAIAARLGPGPREDLRAIADRRRRNIYPIIANAGWEMYDRYLKANRVAAGAASYGHVLRLVLGTELGRGGSEGG
jgi:hypothetical protein